MVQIQKRSKGNASSCAPSSGTAISQKTKQRIFGILLATTSFALMFVMASFKPRLPFTIASGGSSSSQSETRRQSPILLSTPNHTKITTDVRGNLGPPEVMLQDGTDWLKDRWQAASDMHGTAIKGHREVLLAFHETVQVNAIILDWEAAYSKDYFLEGALQNLVWFPLYDTRLNPSNNKNNNQQQQLRGENSSNYELFVLSNTQNVGQSPGVKTKTPLHVIHTLARNNRTPKDPPTLQYLRLTIRSSAMGWGVSLWQIKVFGWRQEETKD